MLVYLSFCKTLRRYGKSKWVHFEPELHKICLKIKKQTHSGPYRVPLFLKTVC